MATDAATSKNATSLCIQTRVTEESLDRVEAELVDVFYVSIQLLLRRLVPEKFQQFALVTAWTVSVLGVVLALYPLITNKADVDWLAVGIFLFLYFTLLLVLSRKSQQHYKNFFVYSRPYLTWLAKPRISRLLATTKRAAPFNAKYDFRGNHVTYYRMNGERSERTWAQRIGKYRLTGDGFTLFFKRESSLYPYAIILHDPSASLESYLDGLGIRSITRTMTDGLDLR